MSIPAMDAVNAKRVGLVSGDNYEVMGRFYDKDEERVAGGEVFQEARPSMIRTSGSVCIDRVMRNPHVGTIENMTDAFWREANRLYEAVQQKNELSEFEEQGLRDIEFEFLQSACGTLSNQMNTKPTTEYWTDLLKQANREVFREGEIFGNEGTLEDAELGNQIFIPEKQFVEDWALYRFDSTVGEYDMDSIWYRYESLSGSVQEIPLVYDTDDFALIVSSDASFGEDPDCQLSGSTLEALENRDSESADDTGILSLVSSASLTGQVAEIFDHATEGTLGK